MICCLPSNSVLKVWKNSSWVVFLPAKNWMSSISSASTCWNWRLNWSIDFSCSDFIIALKNCSERRYSTRMPGLLARIRLPAAYIRWVLPRPVPPYSSSGL